jgi:hypothetical protein
MLARVRKVVAHTTNVLMDTDSLMSRRSRSGASAGASLVPSPAIATSLPPSCSLLISAILSSGLASARKSSTPASAAMQAACPASAASWWLRGFVVSARGYAPPGSGRRRRRQRRADSRATAGGPLAGRFTYHRVLTHLGFTHLTSEAIMLAVVRNLAAVHPVAVLLRRHFEGTMSINKLAVDVLIQPDRAVEYLMGSDLKSDLVAWAAVTVNVTIRRTTESGSAQTRAQPVDERKH